MEHPDPQPARARERRSPNVTDFIWATHDAAAGNPSAFTLQHTLYFTVAVCGLWVAPLAWAGGASAPNAWRQLLEDGHDRAIRQIVESSHSSSPFLRANAIEAGMSLPKRIVPLVQLGLDDPHPAVRFATGAVMAKLRLGEVAPTVRRLLDDPSASVRIAAIWALYVCDQPVDVNPMSAMLASTDPTVRGNAAMALGDMRIPNTVAMLKELARVPMHRTSAVREAIVRLQIAEAIVKLGDESALNALRAAVYSQFDEVRVLAVSMLGQLADQRMEKAIAQMMLEPPIELQVAAAGALARMGKHDGFPVVVDAGDSDIPTVRAQAAMTLGSFPDELAAQALLTLLDDVEEQVRLSAAAAIVRVAKRH